MDEPGGSHRTIFGITLEGQQDVWAEEYESHLGSLFIGAEQGHYSASVRLDRDAVLSLHAALGEWLYPVHTRIPKQHNTKDNQ